MSVTDGSVDLDFDQPVERKHADDKVLESGEPLRAKRDFGLMKTIGRIEEYVGKRRPYIDFVDVPEPLPTFVDASRGTRGPRLNEWVNGHWMKLYYVYIDAAIPPEDRIKVIWILKEMSFRHEHIHLRFIVTALIDSPSVIEHYRVYKEWKVQRWSRAERLLYEGPIIINREWRHSRHGALMINLKADWNLDAHEYGSDTDEDGADEEDSQRAEERELQRHARKNGTGPVDEYYAWPTRIEWVVPRICALTNAYACEYCDYSAYFDCGYKRELNLVPRATQDQEGWSIYPGMPHLAFLVIECLVTTVNFELQCLMGVKGWNLPIFIASYGKRMRELIDSQLEDTEHWLEADRELDEEDNLTEPEMRERAEERRRNFRRCTDFAIPRTLQSRRLLTCQRLESDFFELMWQSAKTSRADWTTRTRTDEEGDFKTFYWHSLWRMCLDVALQVNISSATDFITCARGIIDEIVRGTVKKETWRAVRRRPEMKEASWYRSDDRKEWSQTYSPVRDQVGCWDFKFGGAHLFDAITEIQGDAVRCTADPVPRLQLWEHGEVLPILSYRFWSEGRELVPKPCWLGQHGDVEDEGSGPSMKRRRASEAEQGANGSKTRKLTARGSKQ